MQQVAHGARDLTRLADHPAHIVLGYFEFKDDLAIHANVVHAAALADAKTVALFTDAVYDPKEFKRIRNTVRGRQLNELTISILGMGRVGRRVGHIATRGFGMRVIYNDLLDVAGQLDFPATSVDKPTLYREADVLSLHVTMPPGNFID